MIRLLSGIILIICSQHLPAQSLYKPRNITQAFNNYTRSQDGNPGNAYWQNRGNYHISLTALPPNRTITGEEQITYFNNSPDTLHHLVFKLIVNIHKPGAVRLRPATADYLTSGVHIDTLLINGITQAWSESPYYNTIHPVALPQPIPANDSVHVTVKWHYEVSLQSGREGMIDSTTYFLAYFYPRIAVYDDYNGWDQNEFNDALEFYNDFNNYTLDVNVPDNYLVWATGTLQNATQVLQPAIADRWQRSQTTNEILTIANKDELLQRSVTQHMPVNTWRWTADTVPDVALAISDHYVWDASSVVVDDATGRRASVQAAYNDTAADFHHMVSYGRHALDWLSHQWPGIPYPYSKTTVVQGFAGMEYPMMANDETYDDTVFSRFVAEHEIAHTYMPFYMGINEAEYGFMDEGWATTFEYLINLDQMGKDATDAFYKQFRVAQWIQDPSAGEDLPIITPGNSLNGAGLGNNEYGKPSLGYLAVKDMLGDALFKKCLQAYMQRWHGRHPIPWDFFHTFNAVSGQDLNWFWSNWFFSHGYIDIALSQVVAFKTGYMLTVENIGGMSAPFNIVVTYTNGQKESIHKTAAVWKASQKKITIPVSTKTGVQSIHLDGGIYMDADVSNNIWVHP